MTSQVSTPATRIVTIDILRGFALLGILLAHFIYWYTGGPLPQEVYMKNYGIGSGIAAAIHNLLIFGKFFAFFAFLFGVSFHLQLRGLEKAGTNVNLRFTRRLLILFLIGMVHHFFWMGDILSIYASLGLTLLFFRLLGNKGILVWGVLLALAIPNKLWDAVNFLYIHWEPKEPFGAAAQAYYDVVKSGSLWQVLQFNGSQLPSKANFQLLGGRASTTIGFFLLGMWVARKGWLEGTEEARKPLGQLLRKTAITIGCMVLLALIIFGLNEIFKLGWQENPVVGFFFGIIYDIFNASLVMVYVTGLALLLYRPIWQKILFPLNYIGKLALTCYLAQTAAGLLLFYHFGGGLFLKTTPAVNYLLALIFFSLQVFWAKWWLRHFYYGPVEWLWRSATIGKWQRFSKGGNEDVSKQGFIV
jgi:uncharacterized protein